eukprot:9082087-Pyramimonas_sp.AAC.1
MAEVQDQQAAVLVAGRAHLCWVSGVLGSGFLLANLYLEAGVGLNDGNVASLRRLARRLRQCRRDFV